VNHPDMVRWAICCSVHRGMLDPFGQCTVCLYEIAHRTIVLTKPLQNTIGYPGDEWM